MRKIRAALLIGLLLGTAGSLTSATNSSTFFDKPLLEKHIPLPDNPDSSGSKPLLSCFYYSNVMVKQIDLGNLGAEQLSILPRAKDSAEPRCVRANAKGEIVIDPNTWSGYFEGVKGNFVFFVAEDGFFGGLPFGVFSASDGRKIFEDSAKADIRAIRFLSIEPLNDPQDETDSALKLRYRRVYAAQCSLRADEKSCWGQIKQITGLTEIAPPDCAPAYEAEKKRLPEYASRVDSYPSVIAYEVEAVLNPRNTAVRVAPASRVMECYLGD
jgi:hypothetical protein